MSEPIVKRRPMIDLEEFERRLRKPIAANPRDDDPLAELARSFAGEEVDPYKTVFEPLNRRPSGAWRNEQDRGDGRVQGARQPLIGGDFAAIEAGLLGTARYDGSESLSASDEVESYPHYPQDGQEHWPYGDPEAPHEADTAYEEVRSRRPLYVMAAMIVAGIAGIGASFGFKGAVSNPNDIATIRAADGPTKIHPETVASTETPDRDATVLGGAPQQQPVAAVNNVEQPADLSAQVDAPQAGGEPSSAVAGLASGAASVPVPAPPAQAQPQPPSDSIAALIEPRKVKTVSVRPDGTLVPNDAPPQIEPAARHTPATPKSTARVASNARTEAERTANAHRANRTQVADAQDQAPGAEAAREAPGSFAVQLAAPATEREARATQVRLMKKFGAELTGFHPSIHKAEVGGKPVYRVRVSGLSSRDEATALCEKIQGGGGRCFVAKN
ncbi:MAG TPA: SPOR domain-containing protein [Methylocella sp.]|nr:SPOR domain-containing protein [Methylocella sp.]